MTDFEIFVSALTLLSGNDRFQAMGDECPIVPPVEDYGYQATPQSAIVFGTMGVDGVHYAILKRDGAVRNDSPVIHVSPMDFDAPYLLLAHSFVEYLATACGVEKAEMRDVLDRERAEGGVLIPFMRDRFSHSRFDLDGFGSQVSIYSSLLDERGTAD